MSVSALSVQTIAPPTFAEVTPTHDGGNATVGLAYVAAPAIAVWAGIIYTIGHLL